MMGHRHLLEHLAVGGLIQRDDSGVGWVCASRSGTNFTNTLVERVQARGFKYGGDRLVLIEKEPGKFGCAPAPPKPKKERPLKLKKKHHRPRRPPPSLTRPQL